MVFLLVRRFCGWFWYWYCLWLVWWYGCCWVRVYWLRSSVMVVGVSCWLLFLLMFDCFGWLVRKLYCLVILLWIVYVVCVCVVRFGVSVYGLWLFFLLEIVVLLLLLLEVWMFRLVEMVWCRLLLVVMLLLVLGWYFFVLMLILYRVLFVVVDVVLLVMLLVLFRIVLLWVMVIRLLWLLLLLWNCGWIVIGRGFLSWLEVLGCGVSVCIIFIVR